MIIIGIHRGHGSSCAIMVDGIIVYASQEERFSKIKNDIGFPYESLRYGLGLLKINPENVDKIIYTTKHFPAIFTKSKHRILFSQKNYIDYYLSEGQRGKTEYLTFLKYLRDDPHFNKHKTYYNFDFLTDEVLSDPTKEEALWTLEQADFLVREFNFKSENITFADHHTCHAYYGYFASKINSKRTAVLTLDGGGDKRNQTLWLVDQNGFNFIADSKSANLAKIYKYITLLLGLRPDEDEHKVMGLAPYAKLETIEKLQDIYTHLIKIDGLQMVENHSVENVLKYLKDNLEFVRFDNIAGSVQLFVENLLKELVNNICKELEVNSMVFSGGLALNIKANKVLSELDCISEFFVPASPGDDTLSVGACYFANNGGDPLENMYLGFELKSANLQINNLGENYEIIENVKSKTVGQLLAQGKIIARMSGKAEFGARALGNRSILAHPGKIGIKDEINRLIKKRDFWMPFAISVMGDKKDLILKENKKTSGKYMTVGFSSLEENIHKIYEGIHIFDHTTRPHFVNDEDNPEYYKIINEFYKITSIPAILNTSFNLHRKPICNDIYDAIFCLENSGLEYLLYNNTLIKKIK